jgi:hypothetical protein
MSKDKEHRHPKPKPVTHEEIERLHRSKDPVAFGSDHAPVNHLIAHVLQDVQENGRPFTLISGDRRDGIAQRFGHESQQQVWDDYQAGRGYPANPPGGSTHEYKNGFASGAGVAYHTQFKAGADLPPRGLGLDFASGAQAEQVMADAAKLGYKFFRPYPGGSEAHHLCLEEDPVPVLRKRGRL